MLLSNRVIWSKNGILSDISSEMSDVFSGTKVIDVVSAQDALYIGSEIPFNHRYFNLSSPNAVASVPSVSLWNGNNWVPAVDVIDETKVSGASMAQSGILAWVLDREETWDREDTSEHIPALSTLKIYNLYWAKITWSVDFTNTTAIQYVGHKFSKDTMLGGFYPDLNTTGAMTAFEAGKASWDEQTTLAAEEIIRDLKYKAVIWSENQIVEWQQFGEASVHKLAEIIFTAFGDDYEAKRKTARDKYERIMSKMNFNIDLNQNTRIDPEERCGSTGMLVRR